ncbi:unnamed protein product, partial [Brassica oleracea]
HLSRPLCPAPLLERRKHVPFQWRELVPSTLRTHRRRRWEVEHHRVPPAKITAPIDHSSGVSLATRLPPRTKDWNHFPPLISNLLRLSNRR